MAKVSNPKNQHFLAQIFLKGFTDDSENIYMYDNKDKKVSQPRNIESVARERHLYTVFQAHGKNFSIEKKFSEIESFMAPIFRNLQVNGFSDISHTDIQNLVDFIALTVTRTPLVTRIAEEVSSNEDVRLKMISIHKESATKVIEQMSQNKGFSYALGLSELFKRRHEVLSHNFDIFLLTAEADNEFIVNDTYMCLEFICNKIHYVGEDVDWDKMQVKKHFPLTKRLCVTFFPKVDKERLGCAEIKIFTAKASASDVRVINFLSFAEKERYVYASNPKIFNDFSSNDCSSPQIHQDSRTQCPKPREG
ncbi:MAG: hypothetical protein COY40_06570 [Alphaproteobacteria bacterium CG_4_10_14_0_8_um_filter_53_9]|nr:MAG: hypothetical protein COY40_06570 [Alphaproteobacteria bacterium CG_4_10_14_0_8_um_filter_53_9]